MPGTLTHSPAHITSQLIIDLGLGVAASTSNDWSTFVEFEPAEPDKSITVYNTDPIQQGNTQADGEQQEQHGIQVRVRAPDNPDSWTKANSIATTLDTQGVDKTVVVGGTTYKVKTVSRVSGPLSLGKPEGRAGKRNVFTINFVVSVRQSS